MIETVKIQGSGYLLNGTMYVPKADGNIEYELIKEWLKTNEPEPEFTDEEIQKQELQIKINEAKEYLTDTGWYVERLNDPSSGKEVPEDIFVKRAEARELINTLEAELVIIGAK